MTTTKKGRAIQEAPLLLQRPREEPPPGWSINPAGWRRNKGAQAEGGCKHYSPPPVKKTPSRKPREARGAILRRQWPEPYSGLGWKNSSARKWRPGWRRIFPTGRQKPIWAHQCSTHRNRRRRGTAVNAGDKAVRKLPLSKPSVGDGPFQQCNEWNQCVETGNIGVYRRTVATRRGPCTAVKIGSWRVVLDCFRD